LPKKLFIEIPCQHRVLGALNEGFLQLAMVGAGLARTITVDSLSYQAEALDAMHPEFADIDEVFNSVLKG